jgi:hypothetical protein
LPTLRRLPSVTYPELAPHLLHVNSAALIGEARIAGDDQFGNVSRAG